MINHPNLAKAPFHCAVCGKPAHKCTERILNPHLADEAARRAWDYRGNMLVVNRDYHWYPSRAETQRGGYHEGETPVRKWLYSVSVWDGETWALDYGPFCTLKCAEAFARAAYRAGYRINTKAAA